MKMELYKNFGWVVLTAVAICFPATIISQSERAAPLWYVLLSSLTQSFAIGLVGIAFGAVALVSWRNRKNGGLKGALIITAVISSYLSFSSIYPLIRS